VRWTPLVVVGSAVLWFTKRRTPRGVHVCCSCDRLQVTYVQTLPVPSSCLCFQETVYSFTNVGNQIGCDGADQGGVVLCRGEIPLHFLAAFLGAFAKFRKATVSVVMSVCLSVRTHGTTRLPLSGFSRNLIFAYFSKLQKIKVSLKLDTPHDDQCTFLITSRSVLLRTRNVTKDVEKIETHILCSVIFFFRKSCHLCGNLEKMWSQRGHRCKYSTAHELCVLVNLRLQTHSEYVILITFPLQQWLRERSVILRYTYIVLYMKLSACPQLFKCIPGVFRRAVVTSGLCQWVTVLSVDTTAGKGSYQIS